MTYFSIYHAIIKVNIVNSTCLMLSRISFFFLDMYRQVFLLLTFLLLTQCQSLTFQLQDISLQFIYTPQTLQKSFQYTFKTALVLKHLVHKYYSLSGDLINEKILIINHIDCQQYSDVPVSCYSNFNSNYALFCFVFFVSFQNSTFQVIIFFSIITC